MIEQLRRGLSHVNILHLSDLHFSFKNSAQSNLLRGPLLNDLEQLSGTYYKPDLVVFSGDIVRDPDEPVRILPCGGVY